MIEYDFTHSIQRRFWLAMVPLNILVALKSLEIEGHANPAVHLTFSCAKVDGTTPQRWLQHQGRLMWKSFRLTNIEIRSLTFFFWWDLCTQYQRSCGYPWEDNVGFVSLNLSLQHLHIAYTVGICWWSRRCLTNESYMLHYMRLLSLRFRILGEKKEYIGWIQFALTLSDIHIPAPIVHVAVKTMGSEFSVKRKSTLDGFSPHLHYPISISLPPLCMWPWRPMTNGFKKEAPWITSWAFNMQR